MLKYTFAALMIPAALAAEGVGDSFVTLYGGVATKDEMEDVFTANVTLDDTYMVGVGLGTKIGEINRHIDVEAEGVLVQYAGGQSNQEVNAGGILRWKTFPWNETVRTTVAAGLGLSYALGDPTFEREINYGSTERLLAYLPIELTFAKPESPWEGTLHLHHRSSAFGTFGKDGGGANHLTLGVRKRF